MALADSPDNLRAEGKGMGFLKTRRVWLAVYGLLLVCGICATALAGPLEDGHAAYDKQDYKTAFKLWRPLADQGDAEGQRLMGSLYLDGLGVNKDYTAARGWFLSAANQGDAKAQYNIGMMYRQGLGVAQNDAEAVKWFRLSAGQGNAEAQFKLGTAYKFGYGVTLDPIQAYMWYSFAAARNAQYVISRNSLARKLTQSQIDEATRMAIELKPVKN